MADPTTDGMRKAIAENAARAMAPREAPEETTQVLTFALADEWHGMRLADLVEIVGGVEPTPVPFTPAFIPGVMNHRGSVVAVVDLRRVFGLPTRYRKEARRIILARSGDTTIGFEADELSDVVDITAAQVERPPATMERGKADFIEGCVRQAKGLLVLISVRALVEGLRAGAIK